MDKTIFQGVEIIADPYLTPAPGQTWTQAVYDYFKALRRQPTEDDKALHRAIGAVKRERGENASPPNTGLNSDA